MVQLRFISPEPVHHEGDRPNHWIVLNDGQPDVIRRYAGYLVFERDHVGTQVSYAPLDDAERILPPPGNKIAIPDESGPDALLAAALRQMQTGIWEVDATITMQNKLRVHGLLADTDCDLTLDAENGKDIREIILKGKNWGSFDGGNSWKSLPANDKLIYSWVHTPILYQISLPPFEIVDKEPRDGETWVHLRLKVTGPNTDKAERSHYWIAIDGNGKPDGVRQHEGFLVSRDKMDQPVKCEATYRRAAATAAIKPPPDGDAAKTGDAGRKIPAQNSKTLSLLDGKLTLDVPADFVREPAKKGDRKSLAKFARKDGAWGEVLRGTNGLTPDALPGYLKKRVEEYSKSFDWLPPDLHIEWLRKEIVTFNGREWADWRFVPMGKDSKEYQSSPVYTRFLTTSYKGQLLEVTFTTNLNTEPSLKKEIDAIMDSVRLED
jgi:hypothetical protein